MARFSLADLKDFVSLDANGSYWVGIDVHKKSYHIALLRDNDQIFTWRTSSSNDSLVKLFKELLINISAVCYESGPTGFSLARKLKAAGIPVIVAAPSKIFRSVSAGSKTDRLDCIKLARMVRSGLVKSIAIPSTEEENQRALLRHRSHLVDNIRRCRQRIKAMFLYHDMDVPDIVNRWYSGSLEILKNMDLDESLQLTLDSHVRELEFLEKELRTIESQLRVISNSEENQERSKALKSVPGVGDIVSVSFMLEIFRPQRFKRKEEIAAYVGLAPTVRQSGESSSQGYLLPVGQKRLRSLLVEAAWIWKSRDGYAQEIYNKVLSRTNIPQKAITAVARRLSIILWRLSIEQRAYRPRMN